VGRPASAGIRTSQTVDDDGAGSNPAVTTGFVIDANNHTGHAQVLEERNPDAAAGEELIRSFAFGHDMIAQYEPDGQGSVTEAYLLADGHGSTRLLSDSAAAVCAVYAYDAYGVSIGTDSDSTLSTTLLYSGERTDALTGLQYLRARYYDAASGRFTRMDPYAGDHRDPQSLHKYAYCHGDPVNGVDPSGKTLLGLLLGSAFRAGGFAITAGKTLQALGLFTALTGTLTYLSGAVDMLMMSMTGQYSLAAVRRAMALKSFGTTMMVAGGIMMAGGYALQLAGMALKSAATSIAIATSSHYKTSPIAVIGTRPGYVELGRKTGSNYFDIPDTIWKTAMTESQRWEANRTFLDEAIANGKVFQLSTPFDPTRTGSGFYKEVTYLLKCGYEWAEQGMALVPKGMGG